MPPFARMAIAAVLAAGCGAKGTPTPTSDAADGPGAHADAARGGLDGTPGSSDHPPVADLPPRQGARDGAPGLDVPAADRPASDGGGRIPRPPAGVPPCAPDAMAVHGSPCPYPVLVACMPSADARPSYVCYCFAPPSSGKWFCQIESGDGGVTIAAAAR